MDREAWQAAVHGVAQNRTRLNRLGSSSIVQFGLILRFIKWHQTLCYLLLLAFIPEHYISKVPLCQCVQLWFLEPCCYVVFHLGDVSEFVFLSINIWLFFSLSLHPSLYLSIHPYNQGCFEHSFTFLPKDVFSPRHVHIFFRIRTG